MDTRNLSGRLKLATEAENFAMISASFPFFAKAYRRILDASQSYTKGLEAVFFNKKRPACMSVGKSKQNAPTLAST